MTERQPGGNDVFSQRIEYRQDLQELRSLKAAALESIEDILATDKMNQDSGLWCSSDAEKTVRKLVLFKSEAVQEDEILFATPRGWEMRQIHRSAILSDIVILTETYRSGPLIESASVSIREYVEGSEQPFISKYLIERFMGGSAVASVSRTDVLNGKGLDEREMLSFDFHEFDAQLRVIAAIRRGLPAESLDGVE